MSKNIKTQKDDNNIINRDNSNKNAINPNIGKNIDNNKVINFTSYKNQNIDYNEIIQKLQTFQKSAENFMIKISQEINSIKDEQKKLKIEIKKIIQVLEKPNCNNNINNDNKLLAEDIYEIKNQIFELNKKFDTIFSKIKDTRISNNKNEIKNEICEINKGKITLDNRNINEKTN